MPKKDLVIAYMDLSPVTRKDQKIVEKLLKLVKENNANLKIYLTSEHHLMSFDNRLALAREVFGDLVSENKTQSIEEAVNQNKNTYNSIETVVIHSASTLLEADNFISTLAPRLSIDVKETLYEASLSENMFSGGVFDSMPIFRKIASVVHQKSNKKLYANAIRHYVKLAKQDRRSTKAHIAATIAAQMGIHNTREFVRFLQKYNKDLPDFAQIEENIDFDILEEYLIDRNKMPQITENNQQHFLNWLRSERNIQSVHTKIQPRRLKPSQKVNKVILDKFPHSSPKLLKPIIVSSDYQVVDGHHRWSYHEQMGTPFVNIIMIRENFETLIQVMREYPRVQYKDTNNKVIKEEAPPDKSIEKWIERMKPIFKDKYGKDYARVLYAKAWKMYKDGKS